MTTIRIRLDDRFWEEQRASYVALGYASVVGIDGVAKVGFVGGEA